MGNFQRLLLLAGLGLVLLTTGCTSAVEAYCTKAAECDAKDCEGTDDACAELQTGQEESCIAEGESQIEAIRTGGTAVCDECADAYEAWAECMGAIESCDKFKDGASSDGECSSEGNKLEDNCGNNVADECLGYN